MLQEPDGLIDHDPAPTNHVPRHLREFGPFFRPVLRRLPQTSGAFYDFFCLAA